MKILNNLLNMRLIILLRWSWGLGLNRFIIPHHWNERIILNIRICVVWSILVLRALSSLLVRLNVFRRFRPSFLRLRIRLEKIIHELFFLKIRNNFISFLFKLILRLLLILNWRRKLIYTLMNALPLTRLNPIDLIVQRSFWFLRGGRCWRGCNLDLWM